MNGIKSKYILLKIFDLLLKKKTFKIIKYNQKIQDILEIELDDYINFHNLIPKIEIELSISNNISKEKNIFIKSEEIESYYNIYFDDRKEKIYKNYITSNDKVKKIKILINNEIESLNKLFFDCECIKEIKFTKFKRDDIKNINFLFRGCTSLAKIDFSNFNTDNVHHMAGMFANCLSLQELNLSNFSTRNVWDMNAMFRNCSSLQELNLSNFNTFQVNFMNDMFKGCSSLKIKYF